MPAMPTSTKTAIELTEVGMPLLAPSSSSANTMDECAALDCPLRTSCDGGGGRAPTPPIAWQGQRAEDLRSLLFP